MRTAEKSILKFDLLRSMKKSSHEEDFPPPLHTHILYLKTKVYKDGSLGLMWTFKT